MVTVGFKSIRYVLAIPSSYSFQFEILSYKMLYNIVSEYPPFIGVFLV